MRTRLPRAVLPLLLLPAGACRGTLSRIPDGLRSSDPKKVFLAIDEIAGASEPAGAPALLFLMRKRDLDLALRTRAASALAEMGFPIGEDFCLAVLGALLPGSEETDRLFGIPKTDRLAFPREIALLFLEKRIREAGKTPPFYDVNQGAPDLRKGQAAFRERIRALPALRPRFPEDAVPLSPPPGFTDLPWAELRSGLFRASNRRRS